MVIYLVFNARYEPLLYNSASNDDRFIRLGGERTFRTKHTLDDPCTFMCYQSLNQASVCISYLLSLTAGGRRIDFYHFQRLCLLGSSVVYQACLLLNEYNSFWLCVEKLNMAGQPVDSIIQRQSYLILTSSTEHLLLSSSCSFPSVVRNAATRHFPSDQRMDLHLSANRQFGLSNIALLYLLSLGPAALAPYIIYRPDENVQGEAMTSVLCNTWPTQLRVQWSCE